MDHQQLTRREIIRAAGAVTLASLCPSAAAKAGRAPTTPVSIGRCDTYDVPVLLPRMRKLLDQVGGLKKLVAGKTVAVKVNMVNTPSQGVLGLPSNRTYQVHPNVARALAILLDQAGARRIRFLESTFSRDPVEQFFTSGGWNLKEFETLRATVEFEDTRNLGKGKQYHRIRVPWGGSLYSAYELNHSYVDCDVYLSLAKLKNHSSAGVTLSMKNSFGITPTALYGGPEQDENSIQNLGAFHGGSYKIAKGLPQEVHPEAPRHASYLVPRHIVDVVGIRPIDLAIIDGIESVSGGEGPWVGELKRQTPNLLLAGRNPVCTDAVAMACMGYDPMAKAATGPFPGENHLALAAALGLGSNNLSAIEVAGIRIDQAVHPYRYEPATRNS
jgi:uncharacterized protein (DUF362 family)